MAQRKNPFKRHRFPRDIILLAVRWYCRYPLSCRDVRDLLAERGVTVDASTIHRWIRKFGPEIRKRAYGAIGPGEGCSGMWMRPTSVSVAGGVTCGGPSISSVS